MADIYKKISEYNELAELDASGKMLVAQSDETYSVGADTMADFVKGRITMDAAPTQGSSNPVTSNGVYNGIRNYKISDRATTQGLADSSYLLIQDGSSERKITAKNHFNAMMLGADRTPTSGSKRAVWSGGVYDAIEEVRSLTETDDTLSVEDKPADAKAVGAAVSLLQNDLKTQAFDNLFFPNGAPISAIVVGSGINMNNGKASPNNARCRTQAIWAYNRRAIALSDPTYAYQVTGYNSGSMSDYAGRITDGWKTAETTTIPRDIPCIALMFKRLDDAAMTDTDAASIKAALTFYINTDDTLTLDNVPADAKAVGDAIAATGGDFYTADDATTLVETTAGVLSMYDALLSAHGAYVTKTAMTKGTVTLYEYVFTSGNYNTKSGQREQDNEIAKPTILITAGVHGYERSSVMGLYALCKALCENDYRLADAIDYVTLRVIPIVCPSGYDANSRLNSNGVNINRNFASPSWVLTPEGPDYSGAAPGDQYETQIVQEWLAAHTEAFAYIDWHNSLYTDEVSCLLGSTDTAQMTIKHRYLLAIDKIIPYWRRARELDDANIYAYTGHTTTGGTAKSYADYVGLLGLTLETSWNIGNKGKDSAFTIGTSAEIMGNLLRGFNDYYKLG